MKCILLLSLASIATAAKLNNAYIPPNGRAASSSGANAGLQTPRVGPQGYGAPPPSFGGPKPSFGGPAKSSQNQAEILRFDNEMNEQGYHYAYETSDGSKAEQQGKVIPGAKPEEGSLQISGSYSYVGDDGQTYSVTYTADENGYHAEGAHLPTPPPIPEAILKSLQLTAGGGQGNYNGQKSSYDADSGYRY